jgi:hypothetical protein
MPGFSGSYEGDGLAACHQVRAILANQNKLPLMGKAINGVDNA